MAVTLWQDSAQKRPAYNKHWDYWEAIVFTSKRWMYFASGESVKAVGRYLREMRI